MTEEKKKCSRFSLFASCNKYSVPLWQCPQFLFFIMGLVIIAVIIFTYFLATNRLSDPFMVTLVVLGAGGILLIINFVITNSFERMAEASRMKSELVSIVSHQLRAPLTNVRFALDFLVSDRENPVTSDEKEYYSIIKENSERMNELVNNLLTISKIESGNFLLNKKRVSLAEITEKLIGKFKPYILASNVKVTLDIQGKVNDVFADPLWLEQVVENLLDNAIKYTKGNGEIKIAMKQKDGTINFEIHDQGIGIPKEEQGYIFEKFFRSKNVSRAKTHGSGLGLHIVKQVVELLDGKVWFRSEEGKGTTFYFILPTIKS
ncbi:MAG: HAMP domain-containing histidine kinase [Parcubacteria group bacterium]|nr:HAMP domain-containing histidine kinase [Parcubacteria group bacterium]